MLNINTIHEGSEVGNYPFGAEVSNSMVTPPAFGACRRPRKDVSKALKLKRFGQSHFILCFLAICYQLLEVQAASGIWLALGGALLYGANGSLALLCAWKQPKWLLWTFLLFAMAETLYALAWITLYQMALATTIGHNQASETASSNGAEEAYDFPALFKHGLKPSVHQDDEATAWEGLASLRNTVVFHWYLAGQYLLIGVGAAVSVSATLLAIILLREQKCEEVELTSFPRRMRTASNLGSTVNCRNVLSG